MYIKVTWKRYLWIRKFCTIIASILILSPFSLAAQNKADSTYSLQEVVVSARRAKVDVIPVQTLSGELLENLSSHSVADALRYFSGVQLKDYGGIGGLKTVNVRSMGSQHVGVFYDGVEIANPQNGVVDLGRYSLDNMDAISLYNGQKSSIFQPAKDYTSASSIYMETKIPSFKEGKNSNLKATFKTGAFDLINPSVFWEQKLSEKLSSSLNVEYTNSSGKYKFRDKRSIDAKGKIGYDTTLVRRNGDIEIFRIEQALLGKIKGGEWKTRLYYYDSERGYPGARIKGFPGSFKHEDRQKDRNFFAQSAVRKRITDFYSTKFLVKYAYDYLHYESKPRFDDGTQGLWLENTYKLHDVYLSTANLFEILPFWTANFSADFQWNKMNSNMAEFIHPQRYSGWIAAATSLDFDRLKIQGSLLGTFIHESTKEEKKDIQRDWDRLTPTLMLSWQPFVKEQFSVRAFYKDIFRMPTFSEMHLSFLGSASSFLKPEFTKQYNVGVLYSKNITPLFFVEGQVDVYYNDVKDRLLAVPGGANFRWTMMNVGRVKIKGVDIALTTSNRIGKDLTIDSRFNYTYQKAQDYTSVKVASDTVTYKGQIAYIPKQSASAIVGANYKSWNLSYSFIYTGERYTGSANGKEYDTYIQPWYTHDLAIGKLFVWCRTKIKTTMEVNNLLNQRYDVVDNYPMPGTNFKLIFNITL